MFFSFIYTGLCADGVTKEVDNNIYMKVVRKDINDFVKDGKIDSKLLATRSFVMQYPDSPIAGHRLYKSPITNRVHEIDGSVNIVILGNIAISDIELDNLILYVSDMYIARNAEMERQKALQSDKLKREVQEKIKNNKPDKK